MADGRQERWWTVDLNEEGREEVAKSLLDIEAIGHREGGMFIVAPQRVPVVQATITGPHPETGETVTEHYHGPAHPEIVGQLSGAEQTGEYATIGWKFTHAFAPAARLSQPEPEAEPSQNGQPEPVAAE